MKKPSKSKKKSASSKPRKRTIKVDYLARVEGEGALNLVIRNNEVVDAKFRIFEPPRLFEAFLRGRDFREAPDITARICGICPIAYQMSSAHAMEDACGITIDDRVRQLRRLTYCGEWIESHALHVFMLHAPDFLGFQDAFEMAEKHPEQVKMGLKLKKFGNDLVKILGGREIHPVGVSVGGFYKVPHKRELEKHVDNLKWGVDAAIEAVKWTSSLPFPDFEREFEFVSLRHPDEYPFNEGRLVSSGGLDIDISDFGYHFAEEHIRHSTALHSKHKDFGPYFVGPLARFNLNFDKLSPMAKQAADEVGFEPTCSNPFKSIIARSIEILFAFEEALRIIEEYEMPESPRVDPKPQAGTGHGCTEAPRGALYHRYKIDDEGKILDAWIVPPTSQNQTTIEEDLRTFAAGNLDLPDDDLQWHCEQLIRNYDPCISCSVHSLKLNIDREEP
jgi:coenzyme F420-reducing hydrogenase alpha subunit